MKTKLLGLMAGAALLVVPAGTAFANTVSFSFTNNVSFDVPGTVTGTIQGLTDNGTSELPTSVIITSAPSGDDPFGSTFPITFLPAAITGVGLTVDNNGVLTGGAIAGSMTVSGFTGQEFFDLFVTAKTYVFGTTTTDVNVINRTTCLDGGELGCFNQSLVNATPLPATLPLFASGLGALGLLGWGRKKKAAALAA